MLTAIRVGRSILKHERSRTACELIAKPSHVIDITDTFEAKLRSMEAYASQHEVVPRILDQIRAKARAYGSLVGVEYGEVFVRSQAIPIRLSDPNLLIESKV